MFQVNLNCNPVDLISHEYNHVHVHPFLWETVYWLNSLTERTRLQRRRLFWTNSSRNPFCLLCAFMYEKWDRAFPHWGVILTFSFSLKMGFIILGELYVWIIVAVNTVNSWKPLTFLHQCFPLGQLACLSNSWSSWKRLDSSSILLRI